MLRLVGLFLMCFTVFPAFGQSTTKYQVGTITEVKVHHTAGSGASDGVTGPPAGRGAGGSRPRVAPMGRGQAG